LSPPNPARQRWPKFPGSRTVQTLPTGKCIFPLEVVMAAEYRIRPVGAKLQIIDQAGETVGTYKSKRKAKQQTDAFVASDLMWQSARMLVRISVNTFMNLRRVDRRTAQYWIREAAD
jgi:hypothetical protein